MESIHSNNRNTLVIGTFDMFHIGHYNLIKEAIAFSEKVVVAVCSDNWLKMRKNKNPVQDQWTRISIIKYYFPDIVVDVEDSQSPFGDYNRLCLKHSINTIFSGHDHKPSEETIKNYLSISNLDFIYKSRTENISTTLIKDSNVDSGMLLTDIFISVGESDALDFDILRKIALKHNANIEKITEHVIKINNFYIKQVANEKFKLENELFYNKYYNRLIFSTSNILLIKYIDGILLSNFANINDAWSIVKDNLLIAINSFSNINNVRAPLRRASSFTWDRKRIMNLGFVSNEEYNNILLFSKKINSVECTIAHGDLNPKNIIIGKEFNFIDFEFAKNTFKNFDFINFIVQNNFKLKWYLEHEDFIDIIHKDALFYEKLCILYFHDIASKFYSNFDRPLIDKQIYIFKKIYKFLIEKQF